MKDIVMGWIELVRSSKRTVKAVGTVTSCPLCRKAGEDYRWAFFDKRGNLTKGQCIHGEYHGNEEDETDNVVERDIIDNTKVFMDTGSVV